MKRSEAPERGLNRKRGGLQREEGLRNQEDGEIPREAIN